MKIVDLDQRSDEWHKWRAEGIGASEAPILMNSGYSTPYQLWEDKCWPENRKSFMNAAMEHGIKAEPIALEWANSQLCVNCKPVCVEDEDNPHLRASLDGYDTEKMVLLEIKCPSSEKILNAARHAQMKPEWDIQLNWQQMIVRPKKAYLVVWDYRHDCAYIIEHLVNEETIRQLKLRAKSFWAKVRMGVPPALSSGDYPEIRDDSLSELLREYAHWNREKANAQKEMSRLKDLICPYGQEDNFMCDGFKVRKNRSRPKGYDYEQMILDGIDVQKYAKEPTENPGWTITVPRNID